MTHPRPNYAGEVLHVFNRRVDRQTLFFEAVDYAEFQRLLAEAVDRFLVELFEWTILPNHWHMSLMTHEEPDLARFMHWLTGTHAKRWRTRHECLGEGPVYQRPYKVVPVQSGPHLDTLHNYIAWNPVRAGLCNRPPEWVWGSARRLTNPHDVATPRLSDAWGLDLKAPTPAEWEVLDQSVLQGTPVGEPRWQRFVASRLGLPPASTRRVG